MREESKMQVNEIQLKVIAIGLVPVFLILTFALPKTTSTAILLGIVMITGFVVCFIGMSMHKQEAKKDEDLLAIPPKKRS
jgi:high-affinity K+ transport system ATPase subunit B